MHARPDRCSAATPIRLAALSWTVSSRLASQVEGKSNSGGGIDDVGAPPAAAPPNQPGRPRGRGTGPPFVQLLSLSLLILITCATPLTTHREQCVCTTLLHGPSSPFPPPYLSQRRIQGAFPRRDNDAFLSSTRTHS